VNIQTKKAVKAVDAHIHSPNKPKKFKQTLSARKLMQQGTTMSQAYCAQNTKKNCVGPFRTKGVEF
jgi:hypothetical protein